jgi:ribosomal protein S17
MGSSFYTKNKYQKPVTVNVNEKVYHLMLKKFTTLTAKYFTRLAFLTSN